jgi:SAM-dependent methyltransferase/uncharacterized protein YbaR (Trm112 family)
MRERLLDFLCCPECRREELDLTDYEHRADDREEIVEGEIRCLSCGSRFPIVNRIPRMLPVALRQSLVSFHPDFFQRHPDLISQNGTAGGDERVARTLKGYSYQHVKLDDHAREFARWKQNFYDCIPLEWRRSDFFHGKLGADIGCGEGRHLYWAREFGAEMVGIDLSEGVEVARQNTNQQPNCHIVQADIYQLPFKEGVFDFVYSIGVLHHLPRPRDGFQRILSAVRPSGAVSIWVYGLQGMQWWYRLSHMTWLRGLGPHLPRWAQYSLSFMIAALLEIGIWLPCRLAARLRGDSSIRRIPLADACRRSFRAKIRSVLDRIQPPVTHYHTAEELEGWFKEAELSNVAILNWRGRGWTASGTKLTRPPAR